MIARGCSWCHVLHNLLTTDPELITEIEKNFVYVPVDTSYDLKREFYRKYARGTDHTLVLLALDRNGKQLGRKAGFEIVEGDRSDSYHISPKTVMEFLKV